MAPRWLPALWLAAWSPSYCPSNVFRRCWPTRSSIKISPIRRVRLGKRHLRIVMSHCWLSINLLHLFRYVVTNYGFRELYRGIEPVFWRNGLSNALFFMLREEASVRLPKRVSIWRLYTIYQGCKFKMNGWRFGSEFSPFQIRFKLCIAWLTIQSNFFPIRILKQSFPHYCIQVFRGKVFCFEPNHNNNLWASVRQSWITSYVKDSVAALVPIIFVWTKPF